MPSKTKTDVLSHYESSGITKQPEGVMRAYTYGCVAVDKENRLKITLDSPTMFNRVKTTNVKGIGKKYLHRDLR